MTTFYALLSKADPTAAKIRGVGKKKNATSAKKKSTLKPSESTAQEPDVRHEDSAGPDIRINLQIHISADSSADQIDEIFASIAKHIYAKTTKP
jgi:hypothetical protein